MSNRQFNEMVQTNNVLDWSTKLTFHKLNGPNFWRSVDSATVTTKSFQCFNRVAFRFTFIADRFSPVAVIKVIFCIYIPLTKCVC